MDILTILAIGALNIACFFIGSKLGQMVVRGEKIETPSANPIKAIREHRERKEAEHKQDRIETIMRNIESYDGTGKGQEDVPRG
jgi:hypothetical protein